MIFGMIEEAKDVTLNEMVLRLANRGLFPLAAAVLISGCESAAGYSKKDRTCIGAGTPDLLKRRQDWFDAQLDLDLARLVFIDETGLSTKMSRLRGRAICGEQCRSPIPHRHWKTTTLTGATQAFGHGRTHSPRWRDELDRVPDLR